MKPVSILLRVAAIAAAFAMIASATETLVPGASAGAGSVRDRTNDPSVRTPRPLSPGRFPETSGAGDPAIVGQWQGVMPWPAVAVHLIVLHTGKILMFRGDESIPTTWTWDPSTNEFASHFPGVILWCAGHNQLTDGRVLVAGGAFAGPPGGSTTNRGPRWNRIFDPVTETWSAPPDMIYGRYYPTNVLVPDGRTFVFGGNDETGTLLSKHEVFYPGYIFGGPDVWQYLTGGDRFMDYYPRMHLMPNGKILKVGFEGEAVAFDPNNPSWQVLAQSNYGKRTYGTSVMLPPGHNKVMVLGGRDRGGSDPFPTRTAEIIDLSAPTPSWRLTTPMNHRRINLNAVILPDGKLFVSGGSADEQEQLPSFVSELFDPATETWTEMDAMNTFRNYHSSAVVLPDGRVLWAGSNGNPTAEFYKPYYLFRGARPVISSTRKVVGYGETFRIRTPDAAAITSVALLRPGMSTHAFNNEQRYIPLPFTATGADTLDATIPSNPHVAVPGYYMLFILNGNGVPSVARFLRVTDVAPPNAAPVVSAGTDGPAFAPSPPYRIALEGSAEDDGLPEPPGVPAIQWQQISGPGTVTFDDDTDPKTTATFPALGTYTLRLTADDGQFAVGDDVTLDVSEGAPPITIVHEILDGFDDVEERDTGGMKIDSTDLDLVRDSTPLGELPQVVGLRYTGIGIPQGSTILSAHIQFQTDEVTTEPTDLIVEMQDADDAEPFVAVKFDLTRRARTSAGVLWSVPEWVVLSERGAPQRTPDLTPIIQEVVNRPGWQTGNAMIFIFSGTGQRVAEASEGTGPPTLTITFSGNGNLPPDSTIDFPLTDQTITEGEGVLFLGTGSDPDGNEPLSYDWDFAGQAPPSTLEDPGVVIFNNVGVYPVTFTVTDALGLSDFTPARRTITVQPNTPPESVILDPNSDVSIITGETVHFAADAWDPDRNLPIEVHWNFGGGVPPVNWQENPLTPGPVRFDTAGTYTVTFTAEDALGVFDPTPDSRVVTVTDPNGVLADQIHWTVMGEDAVAFNWRAVGPLPLARTIQWTPLLDLAPDRDATIYQSATGSIANGSGQHLHVGNNGAGEARRALIRFDVAGSVPAGSTITDAKVTLNLSRSRVGPFPVALHRVLRGWNEGPTDAGGNEGGGGTAVAGDVTWLHTSWNTSFWTNPGGDYAGVPSATTMVDQIGSYSWSGMGLAADAQEWLDDPNANHGWMLIGNESTFPTSKRFDSRDNPDPAVRPRLTIDYTDPSGQVYQFTMEGTPVSPVPSSAADPFYEALLTDLQPDTTYRYRIASGAARTFRSPPPRGSSNFWIAVQGDVGNRVHEPESLQAQQIIGLPNSVYPEIEGGDPIRFIIVNGDLAYGDDHGHVAVNNHFNDVMVWSREVAYMPAWGNHEHSDDPVCDPGTLNPAGCRPGNMNDFEGRFMLPNSQTSPSAPPSGGPGEDWYWFDYGNVRFIAVPEPYLGAIPQWGIDVDPIMAAAQADPDITFIVTYGHRETWSSGADHLGDGTDSLSTRLTSLAGQYNKLVLHLSAHSHSTEITDPAQTGGIVHLRQPGGGAMLGGLVDPQPSWSVFRIDHLTHTRLHFTDSAIIGYIVCGPEGAMATDTCDPPVPLSGPTALSATASDQRLAGDPPTRDHGPGEGPIGDVLHSFVINDPNGGPPANQPPISHISMPSSNVTINAGQGVTFMGQGSDPDNNLPLFFAWDFDGGATNVTVQNPGFIVFNSPGTFVVTLIVTDSLGLSDPTPATVSVTVLAGANQAPDGTIDAPAGNPTIREGQTVSFAGTGTDPDADLPLSFAWDFSGGAPPSTLEDPGVVTFPTAGTYGVTFTVTDARGLADPTPATRTVTVQTNQAPDGTIDLPLSNPTIREGESVSFAGTGSDPEGDLPLTFAWDFSGGAPPSSQEDPGSVAFPFAGVYTVSLTVTDALGRSDPTPATRTVTVVANQPPDGTIDSPAGDVTIPTGAAVTFAGSGTDPDGDLPLAFRWEFDWGAPGSALEDPGAVTFTFPGVYRATLRVTDATGKVDPTPATRLITVVDPTVTEARVFGGTNDAEETPTGGMRLDSSDLDMVNDGSVDQVIGMRFTGIAIPPGARILRAWVRFRSDEAQSGAVTLTLRAQAADNPGAFLSSNGNISTRPLGTTSRVWVAPPWTATGLEGADQTTPDLSNLIQEIVDRPGWVGGNAVVIVITGAGTRTAESYEGSPAGAPLLHVEWIPGGGPEGFPPMNETPHFDPGGPQAPERGPGAANPSSEPPHRPPITPESPDREPPE